MAKKATKAEQIQEWSQPDKSWRWVPCAGRVQEAELPVYLDKDRNLLYRPVPSGCLEVTDMPLTVILDAHGGDLYVSGPEAYLNSL